MRFHFEKVSVKKTELEKGEQTLNSDPLCTLAFRSTDILRSTVLADKSPDYLLKWQNSL